MRNWLIRLLGGYTFSDVVERAYKSLKAEEHTLNVKHHGKALNALNRAYDIEMVLLGEHRYHGVEKKALDSFQRNLVARLREEFGLDPFIMAERISGVIASKLTSGNFFSCANAGEVGKFITPKAKCELVRPKDSDGASGFTNGVAR